MFIKHTLRSFRIKTDVKRFRSKVGLEFRLGCSRDVRSSQESDVYNLQKDLREGESRFLGESKSRPSARQIRLSRFIIYQPRPAGFLPSNEVRMLGSDGEHASGT